jgi:hypothetical protein
VYQEQQRGAEAARQAEARAQEAADARAAAAAAAAELASARQEAGEQLARATAGATCVGCLERGSMLAEARAQLADAVVRGSGAERQLAVGGGAGSPGGPWRTLADPAGPWGLWFLCIPLGLVSC